MQSVISFDILTYDAVHHGEQLAAAVEDIIQQDTDMFIISKDRENLPCHRALLSLFSPLVARLLADVPCCAAPTIFLPDFPAHLILKFLHILKSGQAVPGKNSNVDIKFLRKIGDALSVDLSDLRTGHYVNNPLGSVESVKRERAELSINQEEINIQQEQFLNTDSVGEGGLNDNEEESEYIEQEVDASIDCDRENVISPKDKLESLSHENTTKVQEVYETPTKSMDSSISLLRDEIYELLNSNDDMDNFQNGVQKDFRKNGDATDNVITINEDTDNNDPQLLPNIDIYNGNRENLISLSHENTTKAFQEVYVTPTKSNNLSVSLPRDEIDELLDDNDDMNNFQTGVQKDSRKNGEQKTTHNLMNNIDDKTSGGKRKHNKSVKNVSKNNKVIEDTDKNYPELYIKKSIDSTTSLSRDETTQESSVDDMLTNLKKMLQFNDNGEIVISAEDTLESLSHKNMTKVQEVNETRTKSNNSTVSLPRDKIDELFEGNDNMDNFQTVIQKDSRKNGDIKANMLSNIQKMLLLNENGENVKFPKDKLESLSRQHTTKVQEVYVTPTKSTNLSVSLPIDEIDEFLNDNDDMDIFKTGVQKDSRKNGEINATHNLMNNIDDKTRGGKRKRNKSVKNVSKNNMLSNLKKMLQFNEVQEVNETRTKSNNSTVS